MMRLTHICIGTAVMMLLCACKPKPPQDWPANRMTRIAVSMPTDRRAMAQLSRLTDRYLFTEWFIIQAENPDQQLTDIRQLQQIPVEHLIVLPSDGLDRNAIETTPSTRLYRVSDQNALTEQLQILARRYDWQARQQHAKSTSTQPN